VTFRESNGLLLGHFEPLARSDGVIHAVSTRNGGVSAPPFAALNLGLHVPDRPECVLENRRRFCAALHVETSALAVPRQVHGSHVVAVGPEARGRGALDLSSAIPDADGLITSAPGVMLMAFSSDCPLLLLHDPARRAIGLLHAGWRGTVARIAEHGVRAMVSRFGTSADDLVACICPSIGPCCFEVKHDVVDAASAAGLPVATLVEQRRGTMSFDLWRANEEQLVGAGVRRDSVTCSRLCTACRTDLFFSHRRERGRPGRFAAAIMLAG